ncbi:MAG: HD domain-containing phosphohydrolase [Bacteriovoracaceae bacterium]
MSKKIILYATPNENETKLINEGLSKEKYQWDVFSNGKDTQLNLYRRPYDIILLDLDLKKHSGIEVLRYIKFNHPSIKVVIIVESEQRLMDLDLTKEHFKKIGVENVLTRPFTSQDLEKSLTDLYSFESWKDIRNQTSPSGPDDLDYSDTKFTKQKASEFLSGTISIVDLYIRLGKSKYKKILNKGEKFEEERINKFINEKGVEYFYFLTDDRGPYINYTNELVKKLMSHPKYTSNHLLMNVKNVADEIIKDIYTEGLKKEIVLEAKKMCTNLYEILEKEKDTLQLIRSLEQMDQSNIPHSFLVCFYSSIICQNLEWATLSTIEKVGKGALLHDIGKLKLPEEVAVKKPWELTQEEFEIYQKHPYHALQILDEIPYVSEPIKQIIYQHQEFQNGTGFPNGLSNTKIYPLAKVLALAHAFTEYIDQNQLNTVMGVKSFLSQKSNLERFDSNMIKALVFAIATK